MQGSYEWQTDGSLKGRQAVINSWEIGADVSLTFPRLFFPIIHRRHLRVPANTMLHIYADQMNRSGFFKMVHVGGEVTYNIFSKRTTTHTITPFRLTYDMLQRTTARFDSIAADNRSIANSFRNQFIPAMQYKFTYDNGKTHHRNKTWLEVSATSSGNITSLAFAAFGEKWNKKDKNLFNNPYAQFLKLTTEIRQLYRINSKNHIATRFMAGIIKSYGNSSYAPYSEQFYIGGANSLRAFTVRTIGPGSYHPEKETRYSYLDETGTLKFEANAEYRFNMFGDLNGALMTRGVLDKNEFYMKHIFLDAVREMDVIASLPEVDPERIVTYGGSQGGGLSVVASGLSGHSKRPMCLSPASAASSSGSFWAAGSSAAPMAS